MTLTSIIKAASTFLAGGKAEVINTVGMGGFGIYLLTQFVGSEGSEMCFTLQEALFMCAIIYVAMQGALRLKPREE